MAPSGLLELSLLSEDSCIAAAGCLKANHYYSSMIVSCTGDSTNSQALKAFKEGLEISMLRVQVGQEQPFLDGCRTVGY